MSTNFGYRNRHLQLRVQKSTPPTPGAEIDNPNSRCRNRHLCYERFEDSCINMCATNPLLNFHQRKFHHCTHGFCTLKYITHQHLKIYQLMVPRRWHRKVWTPSAIFRHLVMRNLPCPPEYELRKSFRALDIPRPRCMDFAPFQFSQNVTKTMKGR